MTEERLVTEVPSSLKQLARLVVRGFYPIEDVLIVDMLVRNPCMKEDDMCELLKFERKMLRARISTLRGDKFLQVRLRMETGLDGKAQKVNYYFINYKTFVNVVKYKLDLMRKRLETEERDATSRASFKCLNCLKTFTDLEADQLIDYMTSEFRCTYCREIVEEDQSAMPKKDSRLLLAKFNEQLEQLYILLREVEGIKLAPEVLEPEPVDINTIRGLDRRSVLGGVGLGGDAWSGEATRGQGFMVEETRVGITIDDTSATLATNNQRKEAPIWMKESTINSSLDSATRQTTTESILEAAAAESVASNNSTGKSDDIMSVLLAHEKKASSANVTANSLLKGHQDSDSSGEDEMAEVKEIGAPDVATMDTDDEEEEEDSNVPTVTVGIKTYNITEIDDSIISEMTQTEKETYVQVFQDYYSHMSY